MSDEPQDIEPEPRWSLARRVLFRFALLYFVLYALPFPFENLWSLFRNVLVECQVDLEQPEWGWMQPVQEFFHGTPGAQPLPGWYDGVWQDATSWLGERVGLEVLHQRTGSGDTAHDLLELLISIAFAVVLTVLWSLLRRRVAHYRRTGRWLHLGVRWYLAFVLLGYGLIKFYAGQFRYPSLHDMTRPLGDMSPMRLVWDFIGFSKPYEVFAGIGETLAGLLLFWRRTSLLGCFVAIPVMTNVVMLNWMYDVPVKLFSSNLLLFSIALLTPDAGRLWALFIRNRPAAQGDYRLVQARWLSTLLIAFGTTWVGFHVYRSHLGQMEYSEKSSVPRPELYGVWDVDLHVRDGEEVLDTDVTKWRLLALDVRGSAWVETLDGKRRWLRFADGLEPDTIEVRPATANAEVGADAEVWLLERGEKTVQVLEPAPRTMAEYRRKVDAVRPTLVLRGTWQTRAIELHLVQRQFELERGFHWVQELPVNR